MSTKQTSLIAERDAAALVATDAPLATQTGSVVAQAVDRAAPLEVIRELVAY